MLTNCILAMNYTTLQEKCIQNKRSAWPDIPGYFSLYYHYSCGFTQWREITDGIDYSFHTGPKKASVEEDPNSNSTKSFPIWKRKKGSTARHLRITSLHEGAKTQNWEPLFPSLHALAILAFDWVQVSGWMGPSSLPLVTFTRGQLMQPKSQRR